MQNIKLLFLINVKKRNHICNNKLLFEENEFGEFDYPVIVKIINVVDKLIIMFFTFEYSLRETNQSFFLSYLYIYFACPSVWVSVRLYAINLKNG